MGHANDHNDLRVEKANILKELEVMTRRESAYEQRVNILKEKISRESEREALERFGPGPHKVKFEVELPRDRMRDAHLINGQFPGFTIELYPLAHMPHSVHLFLEQVYHKLWDGCSFVVNAPHILQAGAHPGITGIVLMIRLHHLRMLNLISYLTRSIVKIILIDNGPLVLPVGLVAQTFT